MISIKTIQDDVIRVTIESRSTLISASFGASAEKASTITQRYLEQAKEIEGMLDQVRYRLMEPKPSSK